MPYSIETLVERRLLIVRHFGRVAPEEFECVTRDADGIMADRHESRLVIDTSSCDSYPSKIDYLMWLHERTEPLPFLQKLAIVANEAFADTIEFLTLAAQSRGIDARSFDTERAALDWLESGAGPAGDLARGS